MMTIKQHIDYLSEQLEKAQDYVVSVYNRKRVEEGKPDKQGLISFHNTIGGKNNTFVDSIRTQFITPDDFVSQWIDGLLREYGNKPVYGLTHLKYIILEMMKDEICKKYIYIFLERSFYRHMGAMMKDRPDEALWELWFGNKNMFWGVLITPVKRRNGWTNDVSEIRRATFDYWTVGHILKTGIVDPENDEIVKFNNVPEFISFYRNILKRLSSSPYEKEFMEYYLKYLEDSEPLEQVPLMIPELRYAGRAECHQYRLDFAILNIYTKQYIGIELSPQSTHMRVERAKEKSQTQINEELRGKWQKEASKRNDFFKQFGITTITFTDVDLSDIKSCFAKIIPYFMTRRDPKPLLTVSQERLEQCLTS